jgi:hypothetical protein
MRSSAAWRYAPLPPFALAAAKPLGGQPDLVALFVVVTGVFGMAVGDVLFLRLSIREGMAKGAGLGRHRTAPVPHDPMSLASGGRGRQPGDDAIRSGDGAGRAAGEMGHVLKFLLFNSYSLRFFLYLTTIHI